MSPALRTALDTATARLAEAGVESPRADAEQLLAHALGVPRTRLALVDDLDGHVPAFDELVARRAQREPLQHLVGSVGFRYVDLLVGPGVFVPRPETEDVVGWAVDAVRRDGVEQPLCVDLCSGSGTIALALAHELPGARVHAVELDEGALAWLRRNADARADAGDPRVEVHAGDVEHALPELDSTVDLVVSNPPYVATHETHIPEPEVLDHDPHVALFAGEDGLDVVRAVERTAARLLRPGGLVVVEHSDRQGRTAPQVFTATGDWTEVADHRDSAGRDRYVTARRAARPGSGTATRG